ncbi:DUF11 domain-containing protein [Lysobacter enzymogenes]|uniref:DUF7933 domain-containing protein n=1 Tax=Lysobacter enzymogenes TaxID=69 RepID=UPI00099CBF7E|nr:DUF11 domain-containing protein [Lysobacter enzymogenes]UZW61436.1 DUF11 domain-containing protein [Lysobacter enzymogenes]
MNRSTHFGRKAGALLCALALAFAGPVLASGANFQQIANSGGGVAANGSDGLRVTWGSNSQFQVRLGNVNQVYSTNGTPVSGTMYNSVMLRVDQGASGVRLYHNSDWTTGTPYLRFTQVSQSAFTGTGTYANPYEWTTTLRPSGDTGITMTIRDRYVTPEAWFTRRITLSGMPTSGTTIKLYQNIDTYLQGGDNGPGFSRTSPGNTSGRPDLVGVAKGSQFEALWWEPSSGTPNWDRYFSGDYRFPQLQACNGNNTNSATCAAGSGNLTNVIDTNAGTDNGIAVQWTVPSGASNFVAEYRVTFALTSVDLAKRFAPATINAGGVSTLTFELTNKSTNSTNSINFRDTLPANVVVAPTPNVRTSCPSGGALGTSLPSGMSVTAVAGSGSITVAGASLNGATGNGAQRACQIAVDVTSATVGIHHNTNANIDNTNNLVNLVGDETLTVVQPQLTASKSVVGALAAGQTGAAGDGYFNIGVQNSGSGATSGAIAIADTLPAGFSLVSASSAQGAVNCGTLPATGTVTCSFTPTAPIAAGDSASVRLNVAIAATATGSPVNHVGVAGGGDPDPLPACPSAGNAQCAQTPSPIAVNVSLSLIKTEDPVSSTYTPGTSTVYTLSACNATGPAVANGATLSDPLPNGARLSGPWSCTGTGNGTCPSGGGAAGDAAVNIAGLVLPVGGCINVRVPVQFNPNPSAY